MSIGHVTILTAAAVVAAGVGVVRPRVTVAWGPVIGAVGCVLLWVAPTTGTTTILLGLPLVVAGSALVARSVTSAYDVPRLGPLVGGAVVVASVVAAGLVAAVYGWALASGTDVTLAATRVSAGVGFAGFVGLSAAAHVLARPSRPSA